MKTSDKGKLQIKKHEGLKLSAYRDTGHVLTIGWGHAMFTNKKIYQITQDEAEVFFEKDIQRAEYLVNSYIDLTITDQDQYDALVSFAFNLGTQAFVNAKDQSATGIRIAHNRGFFKEAARQWRRWIYDNGKRIQGLVNRREREIQLYEGKI